jgi:hypothetical protein
MEDWKTGSLEADSSSIYDQRKNRQPPTANRQPSTVNQKCSNIISD